ncbi:M48 family metalloprotease [Acuticoccus sp.]|uniref:M48 family metalloprotease n=1 Tax=Acuticoccus sp. TaxID=1904378 RepID=UPI003B524DDB
MTSLGRRPASRAALAGALALALAGCGGSIGENALVASPGPSDLAAQSRVAPSRPPVVARGEEHVKLIGAYGGIYENPAIEALVEGIVARLMAVSDLTDRTVRVTILNSPAVNAFALPSGDIYVTRGLLALANDESELAAVIAHEVAHVAADHARLRQRQAEAAALAERVSKVVADPDFAADSRDTAELSRAVFSQQQELEADRVGVETLAAAGFDPFAAARFLEAMARFAALPALSAASEAGPGFLSTHPATPERTEQAKRIARRFFGPDVGRKARAPYLRSLDGLLYGDDPREGYVRGREFAHVDLGVAFTVPEGYVLKNTSSAVLATDGATTAVRFDVAPVPQGTTLRDYLGSGWVKGLIKDSVREEMLGSVPVATASALVEDWSFRIGVARGEGRIFRFIFASSHPASAYEAAFRDTLASFRLLSPSQRAAMRPLRIRVLPVRENESAATLAARMTGVEPPMALPLLRVLNGLGEGEDLAPGDLVKIVTE